MSPVPKIGDTVIVRHNRARIPATVIEHLAGEDDDQIWAVNVRPQGTRDKITIPLDQLTPKTEPEPSPDRPQTEATDQW